MAIQSALFEKVKQSTQIDLMVGARLEKLEQSNEHIYLTCADGQVLQAAFAVAADGARSWLRQQAGIGVTSMSYAQQAIVAAVKTALPHQQIARQVFLKTGPLAFLPLQDSHTSSIVWSLPDEQAKEALALDEKNIYAAAGNGFFT